MSGLQLCPKCKKGHLYPVVTVSASTEPKGQFRETGRIRDYECAICGYRQKAAKETQKVHIKDKLSARVKRTKKLKEKPKLKTKPKPKAKAKRKRTKQK